MTKFVSAATLMFLAAGVLAQERPKVETPDAYEIHRATGPIEIDGVMDEPAWSMAPPMPLLVETFPAENVAAPVKTEAFLTYDDSNVYVGIHAHDPEPSKIRAHLSDRDKAFSDDFVGVVFDTFNDERRGFEFFVNPLGVQMDLFQNDVGGEEDATWDAIWNSAGRITADGYVVEMAIPFSSLRFKEQKGKQTWGVDILRIWPRDQRRRIGLNVLDRNRDCYVCEFAKITGFEGITPGKNLELTPTVTAQRTDVRSDFPRGVLVQGDGELDAGLSARWGFTPNLTLNAAINPDFSQVEADSAQLDINTQFALFFEEKRPFFLEGADFFRTPLNVVYTRTVADPDWGGKISGKEGKNAIGAFVTQDAITNIVIPGSQGSAFTSLDERNISGAVRHRYDIGSTSTIGLIASGRSADDYSNLLGGLDGYFRVSKSDTVSAQVLQSRTEYPAHIAAGFNQPTGTLEDPAMSIEYRHSTRSWFWRASYVDIGTEFRADAGFLPQVDYRRGLAGLEHTWWGNDKTWYNRFFWGGDWDRMERNSDSIKLEEEFETWFGIFGPRQSFLFVDVGTRDRYFNGQTFDENFMHFYVEWAPSGTLYVDFDATIADQIDFVNTRLGDRLYLNPFIRYNLGRNLRLEFDHDYETLDLEGGRLYTANLSQLRTVYQLNIRTFVRAILQYADIERDAGLYTIDVDSETREFFPQLLFSYKLNPQTVLFIGYSENRFGDEFVDLTQHDRTFFAKVGYAWLF